MYNFEIQKRVAAFLSIKIFKIFLSLAANKLWSFHKPLSFDWGFFICCLLAEWQRFLSERAYKSATHALNINAFK